MPIGDSYNVTAKNVASRAFQKFFGTPDLHTHLRLRPVCAFFKRFACGFSQEKIEAIEPGCGVGANAFELMKISARCGRGFHYIGIDMNGLDIEKAQALCLRLNCKGALEFFQSDAAEGLKRTGSLKADIILFIDILEHVEDAKSLISEACQHLKEGGLFIVSVPTRRYPKIFGRNFHERIGHLREGYSMEELDELFAGSFKCRCIEHSYNTGLVGNIGCWLYYNVLGSTNNYFNFLKGLVLYPFIWLDLYNSPGTSCTLFAVYRKE